MTSDPRTGTEAREAAQAAVLRSREAHRMSYASVAHDDQPEQYRCVCGDAHSGPGSLAKGRHHDAVTSADAVLAALAAVPEDTADRALAAELTRAHQTIAEQRAMLDLLARHPSALAAVPARPDEGLRAALGRVMALHNPTNHADAVLWNAVATALAAPAAAPVGDEEAREAAAAVIRRARYQPAARAERTFDQHLADELHAAGLLAAPGDEGAARAAVARVLALCDEADRHKGLHKFGAVDTDVIRAALSAVSGEHREAEDGQ